MQEVYSYLSIAFSRFPHGPDDLNLRESRGGVHLSENGHIEIGKPVSGGFGYVPANRALSDALPYFYMEVDVVEDGAGLIVVGLMNPRFVLNADRCVYSSYEFIESSLSN